MLMLIRANHLLDNLIDLLQDFNDQLDLNIFIDSNHTSFKRYI